MKNLYKSVFLAVLTSILLLGAVAPSEAKHTSWPSVLEQEQKEMRILIKKVMPTTVRVNVEWKNVDSSSAMPESGNEKNPKGALGSGFIISNDGLVVTNNHVVTQGGNANVSSVKITVVLKTKSGKKEVGATVIGTDKETDIALLKMDLSGIPPEERSFKVTSWGNSRTISQGDTVMAVGTPFGFDDSVSKGVISFINRYVESGYVGFIQHDAPVNKGNSGGPLFNVHGEIVGINSAVINPSQAGGNIGISLAIPSYTAQYIVEKLWKFGKVRRAYIGVKIGPLIPSVLKMLDLPNNHGVFVHSVEPNNPAYLAGIERDDVILSWNGEDVPSLPEFVQAVARSDVGVSVPVEVWRNRKKITLFITPIYKPPEPVLKKSETTLPDEKPKE